MSIGFKTPEAPNGTKLYSPAKLIAVTGPDGSGKSTLCENLKTRLSRVYGEDEIQVVSIWDGIEHNQLFCTREDAAAFLGTLKGHTRTLFLFHAMGLAIDLAELSAPSFIIVDSYWYKYAVSEIGLAVEQKTVISAAAGFKKPDLTFMLDLNLENRVSREEQISSYETGLTPVQTEEEDRNKLETRFRDRQTAQTRAWKQMEAVQGPWVHLDSNKSPESICSKAIDYLLPEVSNICSGTDQEGANHEPTYYHS